MAFPTDPLPVTVEIAPGADPAGDPGTWTWVDITSSVRLRDQIQITQGRADEAARVDPSTCRLRLDNRTGNFVPRNPLGTWYGTLGRNTPLRVRLRWVVDNFNRVTANGWDTAFSGQAWTTLGGAAADYSCTSTVGRQTHPTVNVLHHSLIDAGSTDVEVLADVTIAIGSASGAPVTSWVVARCADTANYYVARLDLGVGTGMNLILTKRVGGVLSANLDTAAVGTHTGGATWRIRFSCVGSLLRAKAWLITDAQPANWQVEVTDTSLASGTLAGVLSRFETGNTNTLPQNIDWDNFSATNDRFSGFVSSWPPRWDKSGRDATVPIEANGVLRRLGQGVAPLKSAPRRYIPGTSPVAYWPLEDGQLVSVGTALAGSDSMQAFVGTHPSGAVITFPQWGRGDLAPWLPPVVSRTGNAGLTVLWAPVSMPAFTNTWTIDLMYASGTDAGASYIDVNPSYLPAGALGWPQVILTPSVRGLDVAMNGEPEVTATATTLFDGNVHHVRWTASQAGTKVSWVVSVDGATVNSGTTVGNMTLTAITTIGLAASAQGGAQLAQGHVAIWTTPPTLADAVSAAFGHPEVATDRLTRLCAEEGVSLSMPAVSAAFETPMGPQGVATLLELLYECADADQGVMYESGFGLGYVPREHRYNRTVDLSLDFTAGQVAEPPEPTDDDQQLRNRWTVSRRHGSSATAEDADSIAAVGVYDDSIEVNHADDSRLADHAAWRVHLGS